MSWLLILIALAAGAANPFQSGTNAELQSHAHTAVWTTAWVYASGLAGVLLVQAFVRQPLPSPAALHGAPWWAWLGGLVSIAATITGLTLAQRLGAGLFTGLTISASVVVSLLLDAQGWLGFRQHAASPMRLLGGALLVLGVWLIARF